MAVTREYPIINGHGHILPTQHQIPESIRRAGYFDITGHKVGDFMVQPFIKWKRPISHQTFFLEDYLDWAEENGIRHTVLITLSQMYCNNVRSKSAALDIMKFQNDFHQSLQSGWPIRLSPGFVSLPRFLDETLFEIQTRYAAGMQFLCLPTHYKRTDGMYVSCTDENCQKIFALANELNLPVQIHPYDYEEIFKLADIDTNWSGHKAPMPSLTAHFYERLITQGLHEKYPNVRFYLAHGNSVGYATIGRQHQAWLARPDLRNADSQSPLDSLSAPNIFCDTIVHDPDLIWLLKRKIGTKNIIHGMDTPYPLGDGIDYLGDGSYPGRTLDLAENFGYITPEEKRAILFDNMFTWLYGTTGEKAKRGTQMKELVLSD